MKKFKKIEELTEDQREKWRAKRRRAYARRKHSPYSLFHRHKDNCRKYDRTTFLKTAGQHYDFVQQPCSYCGQQPALGIDRIDSSTGYTPENSTPCCKLCNQAKNDMSVKDFYSWIDRVQAYRLD